MTTPHRLVLWDIDLTLVDLRGLGGALYRGALANVAGIELREMPKFPGRTEVGISTELLRMHGVDPAPETLRKLWAELVLLSEKELPTMAGRGSALPGAAATLSTVAGQDGVVQSLVTGNLPEIARHKLTAFGLDEHIDFAIGGYGSSSGHRPDLVRDAVRKASEKHDARFAPEAVVVVGDTPLDIEAGLEHDATTVGVLTGHHTEEELRAAGAHAVLADLSHTPTVLEVLLGTR
ncbi:HAD family hydrolase [Amycolatopsis sp. CA-230715]|uniref:HAD family hydrolase n=1 Tax=Amycolatopsis sp. CA-230715 TaxID=2745196 RepID=UPI001C036B1E|nr:HAD hydrolase-like protein [Amycolatopsis sp. CA-230715]QWF83075.1 Phosphoglycolate phosphatase [Amycolatopsis sp. CA-230715]